MDRIPVSSSNIVSVGYDSNTMTLEVEYKGASVYQYFDVPESMYQALMQSDSKGAFMHANVKDAYRYTKL